MTDAQEQAQAAEAPETAAADNAAAQENSAPEQNPQQTAQPEINNLSDLDKLADTILAEDAGDPAATPETEKAPESKTDEAKKDEGKQADPASKPAVDRVRLTSLNDRDKAFVNTAVQMVKDGLATDINDAVAKLNAKTAESQEKSEKTEGGEQQQQQDPIAESIQSKEAEIADVLKELTQAKKDFDDEKESALTDKLLDLKTDVKLLKYRQEQAKELSERQKEQETKTVYEAQYSESRAEAVSLYPDADKPESELFAQIREDVDRYEKENPAIFDSPDYPLLIVGRAAAKLGIAPKFANKAGQQQQATAATQSPAAKVAARPVNPLVGGSATTVSSDTKSAARQVEAIRNPKDLEALADAVFAGR